MAPVGLFGKVPARGDFVTVGLDREVVSRWDGTLAALTSGSEATLGPDWADLWDRASAWGFWIGAGVPTGPCAGILRPSRDSVGRRYPMLLLADGSLGLPAPPVLADPASEDWFAALIEVSDTLLAGDAAQVPAEIIATLPAPPRVVAAPEDSRAAFFAEGQAGLAALVQDTGPHDHGLAAARRSYWWAEGADGAAILIALEGLPDPSLAANLLQSCPQSPSSGDVNSIETISELPLPKPPLPEPDPAVPLNAIPEPGSKHEISEDQSPFDAPSAASPPPKDPDPGGDESPFGPTAEPQRRNSLADRLRRRH